MIDITHGNSFCLSESDKQIYQYLNEDPYETGSHFDGEKWLRCSLFDSFLNIFRNGFGGARVDLFVYYSDSKK
jgi:hypothetical protein